LNEKQFELNMFGNAFRHPITWLFLVLIPHLLKSILLLKWIVKIEYLLFLLILLLLFWNRN